MIQILFQDDYLVAIDKPAGMMVHRSNLAIDEYDLIAEKLLSQSLGQKVFPVHRLDRPTSGLLLFALSADMAREMQVIWHSHQVRKTYLCVVRGFMKRKQGKLDLPLKKKLVGELQDAATIYKVLSEAELPWASTPKYPTSRYSLLMVRPLTGRMHQIRRHLAKDRHYILGDSTHGDNTQNNFLKSKFGLQNLLLHAWQLKFLHPVHKNMHTITAPLPDYFLNMLMQLNLTFR